MTFVLKMAQVKASFKNGSSQGQKLALTVLHVPTSPFRGRGAAVERSDLGSYLRLIDVCITQLYA